MGERNRERQLREARLAYIAATRRLNGALIAFDNSGMPMDPGPDPEDPRPWNRDQMRIIVTVAQAFLECVNRRREWDGLRREWRPSH